MHLDLLVTMECLDLLVMWDLQENQDLQVLIRVIVIVLAGVLMLLHHMTCLCIDR